MTPYDVIERKQIDWPDWETRFSPNSEVRSIPLDQASAAPAEIPQRKPAIPLPDRIRAGFVLPRRQPPIRENKRKPDCEHHASLNGYKYGVDNYGRPRRKCKVADCGRIVLAPVAP